MSGQQVHVRAGALLLCALVSACGDYIARSAPARHAYETYATEAALKALPDPGETKVDRLLVLLDRGMIQHAGQQWEESKKTLAAASKLLDELDAISISEEAGTLLGNERSRNYRGEDFEKLLLHVVQALNYAMLGDREGALVEVRRGQERLRKMQQEDKRPWNELAIARLLGGILYADDGNLDSAYLDLRAALEASPGLTQLVDPLLRLAHQLGRLQEVDELKAKFPGHVIPAPLGPGEGELWVIIEAGLAPQKHPASGHRGRDDDSSAIVQFPVFASRGLPGLAHVSVDKEALVPQRATSVESVAMHELDVRQAEYMARSLASSAIKAGIAGAAGAAADDAAVGWLVFMLLSMSNQADLRSWMALPNEFQVAYARLPIGAHEVTIEAQGVTSQHKVEVKPRKGALIVVRRY